MLDRHPAPGSILDIGSSYGTLLGMFPESWVRVGIEPSGTACQVARERLPNAQIIHSLLGDASLPDASFDVITMVDTVYYLSLSVTRFEEGEAFIKTRRNVDDRVPEFCQSRLCLPLAQASIPRLPGCIFILLLL